MDAIHNKGAREHDPEDLDISIRRRPMVIIEGALHAEGRRRGPESLGACAGPLLDRGSVSANAAAKTQTSGGTVRWTVR